MSGDVYEYRRNSRARGWQTDITSRQRASRSPSSSGIYKVDPLQASSFQLSRIVDPENLRQVWSYRRTHGGQSPGIDRMDTNLSVGEMMCIFRNTSEAILDHRYRPAAPREGQIPKPDGGHRTIEIPTVIDRTVGAAVAMALRPVLISQLPIFYGHGGSCHAILCRIKDHAENHGWHRLAVDDIRNFFPSVRRTLAIQSFYEFTRHWNVPAPQLADQGIPWLVERLIHGMDETQNGIGLTQGGTISPLLAAMVLTNILTPHTDETSQEEVILHRYADNLHIQGPDRDRVGTEMLRIQDRLLAHDLNLKDNGRRVIDVRQTELKILGVNANWRQRQLTYTIPEDRWRELSRTLALGTGGRGTNAAGIVCSFIHAFRTTLAYSNNRTLARLMRLIRDTGNYTIRQNQVGNWISKAQRERANPLNTAEGEQDPEVLPADITRDEQLTGTAPF